MTATADATTARISALLERHPVIDGHNDLLWEARQQVGYDFDRLDIEAGGTPTHTDLPRLVQGGVGGQFWSVFVPASLAGDDAVSATLEQIDAGHQMVARYAGQLAFARTADDVAAAWESGRIASLLGAEGGHSINNSLATLRMLHVLGVRYMTLTHNSNVDWADSATDVAVHQGLSAFGVEVVREMNRIGMLVDLSHVSPDTMRDALRVAEVPAIFSHSSARAVCDSPRNAPDDVLELLRDNNGVCMVTFVPTFVSPEAAAWRQELNDVAAAQGITPADADAYSTFYDAHALTHPTPKATLADVVRHIEHVREVAGVDHVGLGGDYDGVATLPEGLEDVTGYPRLLAALADRGWSDDDLGKLTSGNILRVMRDAEAGAKELQQQRGPSLATIKDLDGQQASVDQPSSEDQPVSEDPPATA
ncbi:dipeptidase [Pedococcus bigeumensis]|uniref:Membrane dipeptidase n=1 Tax=Pedococcus bigeumensis TaxID=433644 RepID=A0A502D3W2_9MICO|nr:dipeptidase [Pedococcus bigeumensis]TPG19512.1 membrane dipeptidase [Pedococcus bigeumensis]